MSQSTCGRFPKRPTISFAKASRNRWEVPLPDARTDPKTWIIIADLPEIIPGKPNGGSDVGGFASGHTGGSNFLIGDGAVRFMSDNSDPNLLQQLGNRADGTLVAQKWAMHHALAKPQLRRSPITLAFLFYLVTFGGILSACLRPLATNELVTAAYCAAGWDWCGNW